MLKRFLGLMVLVFASVGAHAANVLPSVTVKCACYNTAQLAATAKAQYAAWMLTTPPGYTAGYIVAPAGYSSSSATGTYLVVTSTVAPISSYAYATYAAGPRGGSPVIRYYFASTSDANSLAWDNRYFFRSIVEHDSPSPSTFQGATPAQLNSIAQTYIGVGGTIAQGFPSNGNPLVTVAVAVARDNFSPNPGLLNGTFYLVNGMSFTMYDTNGWSAVFGASYSTITSVWTFTVQSVYDSNFDKADTNTDGTYQDAPSTTGDVYSTQTVVAGVPGVMDGLDYWMTTPLEIYGFPAISPGGIGNSNPIMP